MQKNSTKRNTPAFETENSIFATNLRECMKAKGESQTSLADKIGVKRQTVSLYMNGQSSPNTEILTDIANALEVSADYLLGLSVVPLVDEDLIAAHEYTGLSPEALQNIRDWSISVQAIGHAVYGPIQMLSKLCEHRDFCMFLFDLTAAEHYRNPPQYSYDAFMSEAEFRLGAEKKDMLASFNSNDLINLVAPLNEFFGAVALDNEETAKYYLQSASDRMKGIMLDISQNRDKTETDTQE